MGTVQSVAEADPQHIPLSLKIVVVVGSVVLIVGSLLSEGYANMKKDPSDEDSESKPLICSQTFLTYVLGLVFLIIVVNNFLGGKTRGSKSGKSIKK